MELGRESQSSLRFFLCYVIFMKDEQLQCPRGD